MIRTLLAAIVLAAAGLAAAASSPVLSSDGNGGLPKTADLSVFIMDHTRFIAPMRRSFCHRG